ncbi:hypothetical protein CQR46_0960 [Bifidobacterium pseudolongum subsp. globosum]|uniref:Uncharacterized protein n=2 Tax=Bifidobacterium pseudolongum TaxID=1694 RepID=A0A2N3QHR9_9BIFI|nr:hypothetical protein CQR46_0960 [Bifidobacterium pseudolongum subsp. globosum]
MADGHPEALEAALCAVYAPRDPIGEYWQGRITLRALYTLIRHMPPDNAFAREYGQGWDETQWLTADMCAMLRDLQRTLISCTPTETEPDLDKLVRPMPQPPAERATQQESHEPIINHAERDSLMAIATGHTD